MNKSKQKKVPAKTDGKELVASGRTPEHEPFAVAHLTLTAPAQYIEHGEVRKLISNAAVDLYRGLAPQEFFRCAGSNACRERFECKSRLPCPGGAR